MTFPCLAFSTSGKNLILKHTVLPDGRPPTLAFTENVKYCDPKANKTEMGTVFVTKDEKERL